MYGTYDCTYSYYYRPRIYAQTEIHTYIHSSVNNKDMALGYPQNLQIILKQFEIRAIFEQKWLKIGPKTRFGLLFRLSEPANC